MSSSPVKSGSPAADTAAQVPPPAADRLGGMPALEPMDAATERRLDEIEMIGEEDTAGFRPPGQSEISAGMRYLHSSRTIQQLVTDRNRAVGLYLAVASLLWTASTALLNAKPGTPLMVPIEVLQRWCLPVTFGVLSVFAILVGLLLIRTRVGLIYEVAKMNVLLGLPTGRVQRVNPLGIFFIMHLMVSLGGGCSAAMFALELLYEPGTHSIQYGLPGAWFGPLCILIGVAVTALLLGLYIGMVRYTTQEQKLQGVR